MTAIDEIIDALKCRLNSKKRFYLEKDIVHKIECLENPFELVEPILEIIGTNPDVDFGTPGHLILFVEQFYDCGYEELLMESVLRTPTPHNIWMLHRCFNESDPRRERYRNVVDTLKKSENTPEAVRKEIEKFTWELDVERL